jgi:hypothetical protein
MAKIYSKKGELNSVKIPSSETIQFLLNYSRALTVLKVGKFTFETISN